MTDSMLLPATECTEAVCVITGIWDMFPCRSLIQQHRSDRRTPDLDKPWGSDSVQQPHSEDRKYGCTDKTTCLLHR